MTKRNEVEIKPNKPVNIIDALSLEKNLGFSVRVILDLFVLEKVRKLVHNNRTKIDIITHNPNLTQYTFAIRMSSKPFTISDSEKLKVKITVACG